VKAQLMAFWGDYEAVRDNSMSFVPTDSKQKSFFDISESGKELTGKVAGNDGAKMYKEWLTEHGLRHAMSTILHEKGYNSAWIETQLAHIDKNAICGTYNHAQYMDGRREMMQWYADYMDELEGRLGNVVDVNFK
ncbi:tyrosine-type recombinase/integrase, partial [Klebsiella variicola subsp. variicola]